MRLQQRWRYPASVDAQTEDSEALLANPVLVRRSDKGVPPVAPTHPLFLEPILKGAELVLFQTGLQVLLIGHRAKHQEAFKGHGPLKHAHGVPPLKSLRTCSH